MTLSRYEQNGYLQDRQHSGRDSLPSQGCGQACNEVRPTFDAYIIIVCGEHFLFSSRVGRFDCKIYLIKRITKLERWTKKRIIFSFFTSFYIYYVGFRKALREHNNIKKYIRRCSTTNVLHAIRVFSRTLSPQKQHLQRLPHTSTKKTSSAHSKCSQAAS